MPYLRKISYLSIILLAACFPKEEAVEPSPRFGTSVELYAGVNKKDTVAFYSLDKSQVLAEVSPMDWDFYIDEDVIRLNYFRSMRVAKFDATWDKLEDTVDYVLLNKIVVEEMAIPSALLEKVAKRIIDRIFKEDKLVSLATVAVSKLNPPIGGDVEKVTIEISEKRKA